MAKTTTAKKTTSDFDVVKFFKENYTKISTLSRIAFSGEGLKFIGYLDSAFSLIEGEFKDADNLFLNWVRDKKVSVEISKIEEIKSILKKNLQKITSDENSFIIDYLDKDGNEKSISFIYEKSLDLRNEKNILVSDHLEQGSINLTQVLKPEDTVIKVIDGDTKYLEITKRLLIIGNIKEEITMYIRVSNPTKIGSRYISISFNFESIKITQYFAAI